jgi:hypothetical protein
MQTRQVHIGDVINAFEEAKRRVGMAPATNVVRRFGAQYAGTIPPSHWWDAFVALNELKHSYDIATVSPRKAGWKKAAAT